MVTHFIISIILFIITIAVLMATEVKVYYMTSCNTEENSDWEEICGKQTQCYMLKLKWWHIILILLLCYIPILNIILFLMGNIIYLLKSSIDINRCTGLITTLELQDTNFIAHYVRKLYNLIIIED